MTIRAVPCPRCKRVPVTNEMESGRFHTYCATFKCKNHMDCFGETEDEARNCWNGCIDRGDYR